MEKEDRYSRLEYAGVVKMLVNVTLNSNLSIRLPIDHARSGFTRTDEILQVGNGPPDPPELFFLNEVTP
jgi:hypothetical protein